MAKRKAAPAGANTTKIFYAVLGLVAVVGIAGILYARSRSAGMVTEPLDMSQVADANTLVQQAEGISLGAENAPVQVIVFSDFTCPGCGHWATSVEPHIKRDFIDTGRIQYKYYDFPLGGAHKYSFIAARAARCAGDQGKFWEFHDRLFASQSQWSYTPDVPVGQYTQFATDVGLDTERWEACLRSDEHADAVTANKMLGETLGVSGTPTVFVNGRQVGTPDWQNYGRVKAILEAAGAVAPAAPAAAAPADSAAGS